MFTLTVDLSRAFYKGQRNAPVMMPRCMDGGRVHRYGNGSTTLRQAELSATFPDDFSQHVRAVEGDDGTFVVAFDNHAELETAELTTLTETSTLAHVLVALATERGQQLPNARHLLVVDERSGRVYKAVEDASKTLASIDVESGARLSVVDKDAISRTHCPWCLALKKRLVPVDNAVGFYPCQRVCVPLAMETANGELLVTAYPEQTKLVDAGDGKIQPRGCGLGRSFVGLSNAFLCDEHIALYNDVVVQSVEFVAQQSKPYGWESLSTTYDEWSLTKISTCDKRDWECFYRNMYDCVPPVQVFVSLLPTVFHTTEQVRTRHRHQGVLGAPFDANAAMQALYSLSVERQKEAMVNMYAKPTDPATRTYRRIVLKRVDDMVGAQTREWLLERGFDDIAKMLRGRKLAPLTHGMYLGSLETLLGTHKSQTIDDILEHVWFRLLLPFSTSDAGSFERETHSVRVLRSYWTTLYCTAIFVGEFLTEAGVIHISPSGVISMLC